MKNIIIALTAIFTLGCTAPIDIKTKNSDPVLVVMGQVSDEVAHHEVRLSSSLPYFDTNRARGISGADVTITASSGTVYNLSESATEPGLYLTDLAFAGVTGETYTLKIMVDYEEDGEIEEFTSASTMIAPVVADSIEIKPDLVNGMKFQHVNLFAPAPVGLTYFRARFLINSEAVLPRLSQWVIMDTRILRSEYLEGVSIMDFFDESEKHRFTEEDLRDMVFIKSGDEVTLMFSEIDKHYFDFIDQSQSAIRGENPFFGGPASNVTTNISGGAVGFFSTISSTTLVATTP